MSQSVNSNAGMWTVNSHVNHLLKLIAMEWNQCTPIPHFTSVVSNHHLQNAKISSHTQKWEPHMNICDETAMQTEIGDPKNKNVCPCFDYSCVTMLPWTHHCLAFEILAIQLKHSPRWTNRQSHLNYPSRWTNPHMVTKSRSHGH